MRDFPALIKEALIVANRATRPGHYSFRPGMAYRRAAELHVQERMERARESGEAPLSPDRQEITIACLARMAQGLVELANAELAPRYWPPNGGGRTDIQPDGFVPDVRVPAESP